MGNLQAEVEQLRREVSEFKEALELLETPPERYGPKPGEIPLLDYLKLEMSVAREEKERARLLKISHQTLIDAEQRLASKEQELGRLQNDCELIANEMITAGQAVLTAESAYRESLINFETLAAKHQRCWQQLNSGQELYRQIGRIEFPGFVLSGVRGTLTTAAIARDLK